MRIKSVLKGLLCTATAVLGLASASSAQVVISQVYPGGGGAATTGFPAATFISDFIELKNISSCPVDLTGWSIQASGASGVGSGTSGNWIFQNLSGIIPPGGYYLIQGATPTGFSGNRGLPFPVSGGIGVNLTPAGGKIALVRATGTLGTAVTCPSFATANIVDFFGWGDANCSEGARAVALTNNRQAFVRRTLNQTDGFPTGCFDDTNNIGDFILTDAAPRNLLSTAILCNSANAARACCNSTTGTCVTILGTSCPSGSVIQDVGVCCVPNACPIPFITCCIGDNCFASTGLTLCTNAGGVSLGATACTTTVCVSPAIKISQIYGAGDNDNNSSFNRDFIELYNASDVDVDLTNWSIHYASNSTAFTTQIRFSQNTQPAINNNTGKGNNVIPARGYYLVQLGTPNTTADKPDPARPSLPRPDFTGLETGTVGVVINPGNSGKIALVNGLYTLTGVVNFPTCPGFPRADLADYVGYGSGPNCAEFANTGTDLTSATSITRKGNGCVDTNNNNADFMQPLNPVNVRNSSSPTNLCSSTATGACCTGITCSLTTEAGCSAQFQGPTTVCTPANADPCAPALGRCCLASGACTVVIETTCTTNAQNSNPALANYVSWSRGGTCTAPNLCIGACCNGTTCSLKGRDECTGLNTYWVFNIAACAPGFCTQPQRVIKGDLAYGASVSANQDAVWQIRQDAAGVPSRVGTWTRYDSVQGMRFDSSFGVRNNARGNLLGLIFGSTTPGTGGSTLVNLATNGTGSGQVVYNVGSTSSLNTFNVPQSRYGGLAVSPNNQYLAMVAYDNSRVVILQYNAGANPGSGTGASITGAWSIGSPFGTGPNDLAFSTIGFNQAATWLDDSTLVVAVRNINPSFSGPSGFAPLGPIMVTIPFNPTTGPGTPAYRTTITDAGYDSSRFIALAYDPALSPYIYVVNSAFGGQTINSLSVIDPVTWTEPRFIGFTASCGTGREIAIGPDRFLYIGQFAGNGSVASSPVIDRINLDGNANGVVEPIDVTALNDNFTDTTSDYFLRSTFNTNAFNGLGIASATSDRLCCRGTTCAIIAPGATCTAPAGVGAVSIVNQDQCAGNRFSRCCHADFNKDGTANIDDIFIYLNAWFNSSPFARFNGNGVDAPSIDDIFIFLNAWFANCTN